MALITIAHPDYREELLSKAIEVQGGCAQMADVEGRFFVGPKEARTTMLLDNGTLVSFRSMQPTDEKETRDLFYSLSAGDHLLPLHVAHEGDPPQAAAETSSMSTTAMKWPSWGPCPKAHGEDIIAIGRYYLDQKPTERR